jgi:hypothetical protein
MLDKLGTPVQGRGGWGYQVIPERALPFADGRWVLEDRDMVSGFLRTVGSHVVLLAFSLANCSNVSLVTNKLSRPERRRAEKWGSALGSVTYKTLKIEPMTRRGRQEVADREAAGARLHICRGHFKDYREQGLFGRHKGVFWWESHMRGDEERGRIHKDYEVA